MTKKLLLLGAAFSLLTTAKAQLNVSTATENKNVVLEEFTGIYCGFCPDGHKRANQLAANNPGDVVLINIHTGGFAVPRGNDPDYRTPFGAAIASASQLTGYPAGTINRREFAGMSQNPNGGTAMSRSRWASAAPIVLGETSNVNMAVQGIMDANADTMTIDVAMYYTGDAQSYNFLHVAILQNNVIGPQSGRNANPAQNTSDGQYRHEHMLRDMPTGSRGELITTVSQGTRVNKTYKWAVPQDINGVPIVPEDLHVVAFVVDVNDEITTGVTGLTGFVGEQENPVRAFSVYPNPASDNLFLNYDLNSSKGASYSIRDISGKLLLHEDLIASSGVGVKTVDISALNRGVYLVSVEAEGNRVTRRIIVSD